MSNNLTVKSSKGNDERKERRPKRGHAATAGDAISFGYRMRMSLPRITASIISPLSVFTYPYREPRRNKGVCIDTGLFDRWWCALLSVIAAAASCVCRAYCVHTRKYVWRVLMSYVTNVSSHRIREKPSGALLMGEFCSFFLSALFRVLFFLSPPAKRRTLVQIKT